VGMSHNSLKLTVISYQLWYFLINQCSILDGKCVCQLQIVSVYLVSEAEALPPDLTGALPLDPAEGVPRFPVPTLSPNPGYAIGPMLQICIVHCTIAC